jgi:hypothetical protein
VRGGIKRISGATKSAAISAYHIMLLDEQYAQTGACQEVGANQTADARADNYGIVRSVRRLPSQPSKRSFHFLQMSFVSRQMRTK